MTSGRGLQKYSADLIKMKSFIRCRDVLLCTLVITSSFSRTFSDMQDQYYTGDSTNSMNLRQTTAENIAQLKKKMRTVKVTEYMHIPKCGTLIYRNVCEKKGMLTCLDKTMLLNRKCGLIGEHCDWLSKYTCYKKFNRRRVDGLYFFTLIRDPVSRVRSHYSYFRSSACRNNRPKGSGWSTSLCSKVGNYTAWLLDESNWTHNLVTRMLYGRKVSGNACRISEVKEYRFWKHEFRRHQYLENDNMIGQINTSPYVLEKAKNNLRKYFLLWGPQSEMQEFFCVLRQLLGKKKTLNINNFIKGRKTSYPKNISDSDLFILRY